VTGTAYPLAPDPSVEWTGAKRRYDIVKEAVLALGAVTALAVLFAALFSSPDVKPVTVAQWATRSPRDFVTTAVSELDGTSGVATYGPPYTHVAGAGQDIVGNLSIERALGVHIPIDASHAFVLDPLSIPAQTDPRLARALATYAHASPTRQQAWANAFAAAVARGHVARRVRVTPQRYGPVPLMMADLLAMARSGGLDGALLTSDRFYATDYTKPLLLLSDGGYLSSLASRNHLLGSQWGMMNETGNYPGQAWLWLYTFWYQVPPFSTSANADAQIWAIMAVLSLALVCIPFIPGVRSIPRWIPIYRMIWRDYYRRAEQAGHPPPATPVG
jgi:hypothetical protein